MFLSLFDSFLTANQSMIAQQKQFFLLFGATDMLVKVKRAQLAQRQQKGGNEKGKKKEQ